MKNQTDLEDANAEHQRTYRLYDQIPRGEQIYFDGAYRLHAQLTTEDLITRIRARTYSMLEDLHNRGLIASDPCLDPAYADVRNYLRDSREAERASCITTAEDAERYAKVLVIEPVLKVSVLIRTAYYAAGDAYRTRVLLEDKLGAGFVIVADGDDAWWVYLAPPRRGAKPSKVMHRAKIVSGLLAASMLRS